MQIKRRLQFVQQELFFQKPMTRPSWQDLPDAVKHQIQDLCARLIEESRQRRGQQSEKKGAADE